MNAFYNISVGLVDQRDQTKAMAAAASAAWKTARDADEENVVLAEMWENYEELRSADHEALWTLQQAWLDAWRTQEAPVAPVAGLSVEEYEGMIRVYLLRAELDRAIMDAYIVLGYRHSAWNQFWEESMYMVQQATLCNEFVHARLELAQAEAERERLLVEWAAVPVAERKSTHTIFRARVECCRRAEEARARITISPLW